MFSKIPSGLVYGINHKSRSLDSQHKCSKNRFLIGTNSLVEQNQIHHVEVSEDLSGIRRIAIYDHPSEIWQIIASPHDSDHLMTVYNNVTKWNVSLWKISDNKKLKEVTNLGDFNEQVQRVIWDIDNEKNCLTIDSHSLRIWDLNNTETAVNHIKSELLKFSTAAWNPYFTEQVVTASGSTISIWDTKSKSTKSSIEKSHNGTVRDLDINKNNPYYFVSGGDDGKIKFWDIRNTTEAVKYYSNHQHWVYSVKYNSFKDSLVLSAGTDGIVNLWNIYSLSFKNPSEERKNTTDRLVHSYYDHEDSIYSIAWSNNTENPWLFASVSYDGRVIINRVPESEVLKLTE